jgi:hypothetical protein
VVFTGTELREFCCIFFIACMFSNGDFLSVIANILVMICNITYL